MASNSSNADASDVKRPTSSSNGSKRNVNEESGVSATSMAGSGKSNADSETNNTSSLNNSSCQVRVAVRIRPFSSQETALGSKRVVYANDIQRTISLGNGGGNGSSSSRNAKERKFTFDTVFDTNVDQSKLYHQVKGQLLGAFLDGYNATILAYGQTGSGKTYTMGSEAEMKNDDDEGTEEMDSNVDAAVEARTGRDQFDEQMEQNLGLIPRFISDMFSTLTTSTQASSANNDGDGNTNSSTTFSCTASFLEVYGEEIHDLLASSTKNDANNTATSGNSNKNAGNNHLNLPIRENANGSVIVAGLTEVPVRSVKDALETLRTGTQHRTTAATWMNRTSSRSHAVFTISLTRTVTTFTSTPGVGDATMSSDSSNKPVEVTTCSKFTFVDLAGSERMKKTGAEGERAREGIKINEGLLALGNVINALADDSLLNNGTGSIHVPYRQSKLTRLLQDALGGNSQTLFMACVSPADHNVSETLSTLKYANRARNIKNAPTKNVDSTALELQRLGRLNRILQSELIKLKFRRRLGSSSGNLVDLNDTNDDGNLSKLNESSRGSDRLRKSRVSLMPDDFDVEEMLQRSDVQSYLNELFQLAEQCEEGSTFSSKPLFQPPALTQSQFSTTIPTTIPTTGPPSYACGNDSARVPLNVIDATSNGDARGPMSSVSSSSYTLSGNKGSYATSVATKQSGATNARPKAAAATATTKRVAKALEANGGKKNSILRDEIESASFMLDVKAVDPDQEMAILDQLLELQQHDQVNDELHREEVARVKEVDAELQNQEELLLRLKDSLKIYHDMKHQYEGLVAEVQSLEFEKTQLAEQLEKAIADPAKGCSTAIRKKLERIEQTLARTREEKNRHQKMYKKAEIEARKCDALNRKIQELKQSKVALLRKQKERETKHREYTEAKQKEIQQLRKRERQAEQKLTKVGLEVTRYKATLDKRKEYCEKLSSKLKQTEKHLMSVLALREKQRKKKLPSSAASSRARTSSARTQIFSRQQQQRSSTAASTTVDQAFGAPITTSTVGDDQTVEEPLFAPESGEANSASFLLSRMVSDRVSVAHGKKRYEERMKDFTKLMTELKTEMAAHEELCTSIAQSESDTTSDDGNDNAKKKEMLKEHEENIEDLNLRLEMVISDLEDIRSRLNLDGSTSTFSLSKNEDGEGNEEDEEDDYTKEIDFISKLDAPTVRSVLLDMMREMSNTELDNKLSSEKLSRKDAALLGFEKEIDSLNGQINTMKKKMVEWNSQESGDGAITDGTNSSNNGSSENRIHDLEEEVAKLRQQTTQQKTMYKELSDKLTVADKALQEKVTELATCREQLAFQKANSSPGDPKQASTLKLEQMQQLWHTIGLSEEERRHKAEMMEKSLEYTCDQLLEEATRLCHTKQAEVDELWDVLTKLRQCLSGPEELDSTTTESSTFAEVTRDTSVNLTQQLIAGKAKLKEFEPRLEAALERRDALARETKAMEDEVGFLFEGGASTVGDELFQLLRSSRNDDYDDDDGVKTQNHARSRVLTENQFKVMEKKVESVLDSLKLVQNEGFGVLGGDTRGQNETIITTSFAPSTLAMSLLGHAYRDVMYGPEGCLSHSFLDKCEKQLKAIKLKKSQYLIANNSLCEVTRSIVEEMYVTTKDILYMVSQSSRHRTGASTGTTGGSSGGKLPRWWDLSVATLVCATLSQRGAPIKVSESFTKHLRYISDQLQLAAEGRRILSSKLKQLIEHAHQTLISTMDDEAFGGTAEDSYASFFKMIFDLPSLSKKYIQTCLEELNMLVLGAETVAQSETETLQVVWEALNVPSSDQEAFWAVVDQGVSDIKRQQTGTFLSFTNNHDESSSDENQNHAYVEDWLSIAGREASSTWKALEWKLYKVQKIYDEVNKNREKQDMKCKILSLDSELRLISARLTDFEDQAGRKQRLTTKKVNSLNLLKEERFRKQMQTKFASKLEVLGQLLRDWQSREGTQFDANDLSEDVRALLMNLDGFDAWVEQRTAFMHLRSVKPTKQHHTLRRAATTGGCEEDSLNLEEQGATSATHQASTSNDDTDNMSQASSHSTTGARRSQVSVNNTLPSVSAITTAGGSSNVMSNTKGRHTHVGSSTSSVNKGSSSLSSSLHSTKDFSNSARGGGNNKAHSTTGNRRRHHSPGGHHGQHKTSSSAAANNNTNGISQHNSPAQGLSSSRSQHSTAKTPTNHRKHPTKSKKKTKSQTSTSVTPKRLVVAPSSGNNDEEKDITGSSNRTSSLSNPFGHVLAGAKTPITE